MAAVRVEQQAGYWDGEAAAFDDEPDHGLRDPEVRAAWQALLTGVLPAAPCRIADLGCGTGTLSLLLAAQGHRVTGIDFSAAMVRHARAKAARTPGLEYVVGDAAAPPIATGSCDVVFTRHVLWALPDPDAALARWRALLRPGGRMLLVEGRWSTGGGLDADTVLGMLRRQGATAAVYRLDDPAYWGRPITDERYLVVAEPS